MQQLLTDGFSARLRRLCAAKPDWPRGHGLGTFIASRYGKSTTAADRWLNKDVVPDDEVLRAMAADFGATLGFLRYGETQAVLAPDAIPAVASAQITVGVHRVITAAGIDLDSVAQAKLDRLFSFLHDHWRRHGTVEQEDISSALRLLDIGGGRL